MKKTEKTLPKWLTLTPFKVGLALTLLMTWLSVRFYSPNHNQSWILQRVKELHQSSIDIRIRDRGAKEPNPNIAIIAVDEYSEQKLGRWPWPRGRIAEIIERLTAYGVKVIAFDAIFVEPDRNQATISLSKIVDSGLATGPLEELVGNELKLANTDWRLAKTVEQYSDHVVLGSYYDEKTDAYYPYQEYCGRQLTEQQPYYQFLQSQEKPVIVVDADEYLVPQFFHDTLTQRFTQLTDDIKSKQSMSVPGLDTEAQILKAQSQYCERWLVTNGEYQDEFYPTAQKTWSRLPAAEDDWSALNFEAAVDKLKYTFPRTQAHRTGRWWINLPMITEGSKHMAYFNALLDSDGTIRRSNLVVRHGGTYMSSLALKTALVANNQNVMIYLDKDPKDPTSKMISKMSLIDDEGNEVETLPVDGAGQLLVNYAGDSKTYPHMSIWELFNNSSNAKITIRKNGTVQEETVKKLDFLKDKIMIFGATSTGTYDLRVTPFSENYPGVEIHANLVDNILSRDFLVSPHNEELYMVLTILLLGIFLSYGVAHLGAIQGLFLNLGTTVALYLIDRFYLFKSGYVIAIILPLSLISSLYVVMTFYKYLTEERKKKAIKGTFEKYVSPAIVAEVLKHPENINLGGKKQRMTVIFSDLRGFTTISEKLDPQVLSDVLNRYLTPMTELVFKNDGTLDKYMGDAIMAFFGAPIFYESHAKKACQCALDMIRLLPKINAEFKAQGLPQIDLGVGVNTGDMSVGNMGSETVRSYTVMGDAVNLGSRLEAINKQYGTRIIISEFTYQEVKNDFICREVDWVRVKGKQQPVKIFELIANTSEGVQNRQFLEKFKAGFEKYHQRNWKEAQQFFKDALESNPSDSPSKLYLERVESYLHTPPPDSWDGVFEMKTK